MKILSIDMIFCMWKEYYKWRERERENIKKLLCFSFQGSISINLEEQTLNIHVEKPGSSIKESPEKDQ